MRGACRLAVLLAAMTTPAWADRARPPPRVPAPAAACPLRAGWTFHGTYLCAQGTTAVTLRVLEVRGTAVRVEFAFAHAPSAAAGRFTLDGSCVGSAVDLTPTAWIDRMPGYIMVGMRGTLSDAAARFAGAMTHPSCGGFDVRR